MYNDKNLMLPSNFVGYSYSSTCCRSEPQDAALSSNGRMIESRECQICRDVWLLLHNDVILETARKPFPAVLASLGATCVVRSSSSNSTTVPMIIKFARYQKASSGRDQ
jgi:hypothetical protein